MNWLENLAFPANRANRELSRLRGGGGFPDRSLPKLLRVSDDVSIAVTHFRGSRNEWLIYSTGNSAPVATCPMQELAKASGMHVVQWDYPGYDRSTGKPTAANCVASLLKLFQWVRGRTSGPISLMGWSIGSGVTAQAAAQLGNSVHRVVLVSPFLSLASMFVPGGLPFPLDRLRTVDVIGSIACPVLFIHGVDDKLIPCYHTKYLWEKRYARATAAVPALMLQDCGHRIGLPRIMPALCDFLPVRRGLLSMFRSDEFPDVASARSALAPCRYMDKRLAVASLVALLGVGSAYAIARSRSRKRRKKKKS